jgi:16S rRNA G527 N7-methylase RsmG
MEPNVERFNKTSLLLKEVASDLTCEGSTDETMNGEITDGTFLNILKKWNSFDNNQVVKYLDIGSGRGFTVFLARSFFEERLALSCVIEISQHRLELFAYFIYCKLHEKESTNCKNVFFIHRDITCFETLV